MSNFCLRYNFSNLCNCYCSCILPNTYSKFIANFAKQIVLSEKKMQQISRSEDLSTADNELLTNFQPIFYRPKQCSICNSWKYNENHKIFLNTRLQECCDSTLLNTEDLMFKLLHFLFVMGLFIIFSALIILLVVPASIEDLNCTYQFAYNVSNVTAF